MDQIFPKLVWGALTFWEGHENVGFAVRPPRGMYQNLETGKPKSAYKTCIENISGFIHQFLSNRWTDFNQNWSVNKYTMLWYEFKKLFDLTSVHLKVILVCSL